MSTTAEPSAHRFSWTRVVEAVVAGIAAGVILSPAFWSWLGKYWAPLLEIASTLKQTFPVPVWAMGIAATLFLTLLVDWWRRVSRERGRRRAAQPVLSPSLASDANPGATPMLKGAPAQVSSTPVLTASPVVSRPAPAVVQDPMEAHTRLDGNARRAFAFMAREAGLRRGWLDARAIMAGCGDAGLLTTEVALQSLIDAGLVEKKESNVGDAYRLTPAGKARAVALKIAN